MLPSSCLIRVWDDQEGVNTMIAKFRRSGVPALILGFGVLVFTPARAAAPGMDVPWPLSLIRLTRRCTT